MKPDTSRYLTRAVLLAAVYSVFARLGLSIQPVNAFATLIWPPTGIALASLLILGSRFWPAVAAGAFVANVWTGAPPLVALGIGAGNALEALLGVYFLSRIPGFRRALDRLQDVIALVLLAGVASTTVSATIGVASLVLGGVIPPDRIGATWQAWWLGDAIGDLVVAPLILTWKLAPDAQVPRGRLAEQGILGLLLAASSVFIFEQASQGMPWLLLPLLVWAAIRFDERGAARATFLVSAVAVWATARGHGPFARGAIAEGLFSLQVFLGMTAATFLVLGAVMSERRRADGELRRTRDEAEAGNRAKDQFLAALSHELRTPLTPVLAISSVLEKDPALPPAARRQAEVVRRNAEIEARLIDDLLDLTRIAKGKLHLEVEPVELAGALDDVFEICRPEAAAKGIAIEREGSESGVFVDADPARLRQILWNIVKNGIKFTPGGGMILLRTTEPASGRIAVEVTDNGVGIDPSQIGRIFLPFEQAGRRGAGLGLGLAISSALVEAHGGRLTAASGGLGCGATFRVELPVSSGRRPLLPQAAPSTAVSPGRARRVLLVEDHGDTAGAARTLLTELSFEVVTAATFRDALDAAKSQPFDLVVSDLGLPDGSGLDLMRSLRDSYGLSGIAVTGYGMEDDFRRSREAGFVEHLVKPITFQRLATAIERFFAARRPPDGAP